MEDVMEILHVIKKSNVMNTLEKFHKCNVTILDNQINEKDKVKHNVIFGTFIQNNSYRGHPPQ
jgi:hypothetical protein